MKETKIGRIALFTASSLAMALLLSGIARAQSKIQGVINGRTGPTMTVQTQDAGNVVVVLNDGTQVEDVSGMFHARKKADGRDRPGAWASGPGAGKLQRSEPAGGGH